MPARQSSVVDKALKLTQETTMNVKDLDQLYDIIAQLEGWQNSASVQAALSEIVGNSEVNSVKSRLLRIANELSAT